MKKHILGLVVFGWIVVFFVGLYSFFLTLPIPHVGEVEPEMCVLKFGVDFDAKEEITYEVEKIQFDLKKKKLISIIKLYWNGEEKLPKRVYANYRLKTNYPTNNTTFTGTTLLVSPFNKKREALINLESEKIDLPNITKDVSFVGYFYFTSVKKTKEELEDEFSYAEVNEVVLTK